MLTAADAAPRPRVARLTRVAEGSLVAGVAAGIAVHVRRPVLTVRLVFIGLTLIGGFGAVLYAAYWIVLRSTGPAPGARRRAVQVVVGLVLALAVLGAAADASAFVLPAVLACIGGAFLWRQADDAADTAIDRDATNAIGHGSTAARAPWSRRAGAIVSAPAGARGGRLRLAVGAALVLAAVVTAFARADVRSIPSTLAAAFAAVVGVALLTGPWWMRLIRDLGAERRERIHAEEREELAARVHDSVLQTLVLIQRRSDQPREVARLARGQERELRRLLWGDEGARDGAAAPTVTASLRAAAAEVEDSYGVAVDVVTVGDAPASPAGSALAAAAREALVNAAKHAGVDQVSLYVEIEEHRGEVFVRDRGKGFDPATVDEDRQGLRRSIAERMARHGGTASVHSAPGQGTEIALEVSLL